MKTVTRIPIKGYEDRYEISSDGHVWRTPRKYSPHYKELTPYKNNGYMSVVLSKNGKSELKKVHRLIAVAFIENPNSLKEVNHINNKRDDNRIQNLEWVTHARNMQHAGEVGVLKKGLNHWAVKLTEKDVKEIRFLRTKGLLYRELASKFSIGLTQVGSIIKGRKWKHI